jgi:hypothetical protein
MSHGVGHDGTQKTLHRLHADFFMPDAQAVVRLKKGGIRRLPKHASQWPSASPRGVGAS